MEEPLAAAATPDESAATEGSASAEARPRRERRRFRIPTSLLVTLLVALLSVWVAPAFARQWEDRQKARELKAASAEEVVVVVTRTVGDAAAVARSKRGDVERMMDRWESTELRIRAKLRAYFAPNVVERWSVLSKDVRFFLLFVSALDEGHPSSMLWLKMLFPGWSRDDLEAAVDKIRIRAPEHVADELSAADREQIEAFAAESLRSVVTPLLERLDLLVAAMLRAEPAGFSTTRGDLLRDLLP